MYVQKHSVAANPRFREDRLWISHLSREDYLRSRAFLQRYLDTNPAAAPVLYHAIQIEQKLGDDSARREYTMRMLRDFPDSPEARQVRQSG